MNIGGEIEWEELSKKYKTAQANYDELKNIINKNASPDEQSKLELARKELENARQQIEEFKKKNPSVSQGYLGQQF